MLVSHPRREVPLDPGHVHGRVLLLVVLQLDGALQARLLGLSGVLPPGVHHHAEHQQAGADPVVPGQVHGQQGPETFPEGPENRDGADPLRSRSVERGNRGRRLLLGVARTLGALGFARLRFVALHYGIKKEKPLNLTRALLSYCESGLLKARYTDFKLTPPSHPRRRPPTESHLLLTGFKRGFLVVVSCGSFHRLVPAPVSSACPVI